MTDLQSVGVFHFGHPDKSSPMRSLEDELQNTPELANCLLVLPEAFNVPHGYYVGDRPLPLCKDHLLRLSEKYQIAFVAGLIEESSAAGHGKGFNSAYLVDAAYNDEIKLLAQKRSDCWSRVCKENPSAEVVSIRHRGIGLASLICNDFINCGEVTRKTLLEHSEWSACEIQIVCVPACSTRLRVLLAASEFWKVSACVAVSNGDNRDLSLIRMKGFSAQTLVPDERTGSLKSDGNFDERLGYPYNKILACSFVRGETWAKILFK